jgi:hypothetical protein
MGAAPGEQGDILWGPWTNHRTGGHEASSQVSHRAAENECKDIVEEPATAQAKEETAHSLRAREVGAPTTQRTFASSP